MVLANDDAGKGRNQACHYWYAHILGAYHANVLYEGPGQLDWNARRIDFLWVRWYETVNPDTFGWKSSTLEKVAFLPDDDPHALYHYVSLITQQYIEESIRVRRQEALQKRCYITSAMLASAD